MSTSSDSCDLQIRLESSKLVPLFEEMQAIGFPLHILERLVPRIKKGAPSVGFMIYTYIYRTFQDLFDAKDIHLDSLIINEKVIDREKFARAFFKGVREIIQHDQSLPLYQYICPGHPLAKVDEIVRITGKLRMFDTNPHDQVASVEVDNLQQLKLEVAERLAQAKVRDSFSSNKSLYGSVSEKSHSQVIHPASTTPVDIPWQAVREPVGGGRRVSAGNSDSDDEQSPDEGIRSWNTSSINRTPVQLKDSHPPKDLKRASGVHTVDRGFVMAHDGHGDGGIQTVLEKFEQIESLQNLKFRSIEERLIRIEHDLVDNNARFERSTGSRLDNHEVRIQHLERTSVAHSQEHTRKPSVYEAPTAPEVQPDRPRSSSKQSNDSASFRHRSMSRESNVGGRVEQRGSLVPSRAMSVSRSFGGEKDLRDSGFSSIQNTADALRQETWNSIYEMRTGSPSRAYASHRDRSGSHTIDAPSAATNAHSSTYFTGTAGVTPEPSSSLRKDSHPIEPERKASIQSRRESRASELARRESHNEHLRKGSQHSTAHHSAHGSIHGDSGRHHSDIPVITSQTDHAHQSSSTHDLDHESSHGHHNLTHEPAQSRRESRLQRSHAEQVDNSPRESSTDSHAGQKDLVTTVPGRVASGARLGSRVEALLGSYAEHREESGEKRRESRHRSVGPSGHTYRPSLPKSEDSGDVLVDLNERIQLRLRERIKTAEDTLSACIETIRRDYVLLRRH